MILEEASTNSVIRGVGYDVYRFRLVKLLENRIFGDGSFERKHRLGLSICPIVEGGGFGMIRTGELYSLVDGSIHPF